MEIVLIVIVIGLYILEFIEKRKLQRKIEEFNKKYNYIQRENE